VARRGGKRKLEENRIGNDSYPGSQVARQGSDNKDMVEITGNIPEVESEAAKITVEEELQELKDKYLRLYAEFENYKKRIQRDKEELIKYGNESLLYDLLSVIDNLEMALKHSIDGNSVVSDGLVQGVEITLREFLKVLEKFGLSPIAAIGKEFDPSLHHAMTQVERDDADENTVVEEYRKGYMLGDKVLRPSLVAVSKKSVVGQEVKEEEIKTNENIEEE